MDLVAELNNEDTKRKKLQVFKNFFSDFRAIAVISGIAYFVMTRNTRLPLWFYSSFIWSFSPSKKASFIEIRTITEVHFQAWEKYFET